MVSCTTFKMHRTRWRKLCFLKAAPTGLASKRSHLWTICNRVNLKYTQPSMYNVLATMGCRISCTSKQPRMIYSGDLHSKLVWYSNGQNEVGCQMVRFFNTRKPNHLNMRQMDAIWFSYVIVQYLNGQSSRYDST